MILVPSNPYYTISVMILLRTRYIIKLAKRVVHFGFTTIIVHRGFLPCHLFGACLYFTLLIRVTFGL